MRRTRHANKKIPNNLSNYISGLIQYFETLFQYKLSPVERKQLMSKIDQEIYKTKKHRGTQKRRRKRY
jgi:hypothetical protein